MSDTNEIMTVQKLIDELNKIPARERNRPVSIIRYEEVLNVFWIDCSDAIVIGFDEIREQNNAETNNRSTKLSH